MDAMPKEIASAIVSVMGKVERLGKDTRNEHGRYNYVSVDSFFEQIGHLMSDAGIFVVLNEVASSVENRESIDSYGKAKISAWLNCEYEAIIYHASGVSYGPIKRTIQVVASGPQAYGSAMSFVEKYFLRGLFKIPTGEPDADADVQHGLPEKSPQRRAAAHDDAASAYVAKARSDMMCMGTPGELRAWWEQSSKDRERAGVNKGTPAYAELFDAFVAFGKSLTAKEVA